jgi:SAM-dependent methyltransferase
MSVPTTEGPQPPTGEAEEPPPIAVQEAYWNDWNAAKTERPLSDNSIDQRRIAVEWLTSLGRTDLDILEVGCGAGWLCPSLKPFGRVTGTDLPEGAVKEAAARVPDVKFIAGDFMTLDLGAEQFDVVVTLEVLSCVADQAGFVAKLASLLRPDGVLILSTPNRPVLERYNNLPPPSPDQIRAHVDRGELVSLLTPHFEIESLRCICATANKGPYRLILGRKPKRALRMLFGRTIEDAMAQAGFGWALMTLARKRGVMPH